MLGIVATMMASCSQSEDVVIENGTAKQVTFSLSTPDSQSDAVKHKARANAAATSDLRYVLAIYDELGTTEVVPETEFSTGSFAVRLDPGKYTCLFWADHGDENYDAADLKSVALKSEASEPEAFYAKQGITVTDGNEVSVTLNRAVAKVVLKETDQLKPGSIKVTFNEYQGFNVDTESTTGAATASKTLPIATTINGSIASPAEVGSFLTLANKADRDLVDLKLQYNAEAEKTITNVPIQANYVTNICGKFSVNTNQQFSVNVNDVWATPGHELDLTPYVTFSAQAEQKFGMNFRPIDGQARFQLLDGEYFEYSVGNGEWTKFTTTISDISFGGTLGDLRLRGKSSRGTAISQGGASIQFATEGVLVDCTGDIRTLTDYENYLTVNTADVRHMHLFNGCTQLKSAPELPATTLATDCYFRMFTNCTSLVKAPELPATTLANSCYNCMFSGCTSLTEAPDLPATTATDRCYISMFQGCTALTKAPETLPATTLESLCYSDMFKGCTSLVTAPTLPAKTLASYCYSRMFENCTKLSTVKMLATDAGADRCFTAWLNNAGTEAASRTLTIANDDIYHILETGYAEYVYLPDNWKSGSATVIYTDN